MNRMMIRRAVSLLLALLLIPGLVLSEEAAEAGLPEEGTEKDGWHFDSRGFLTGDDNPGEEYLLEDPENGFWQYASRDLSVKVTRVTEQ